MPEIIPEDSPESFDDGLKALQKRMFGQHLKNDDYILTHPGAEHSYFSPYYHFIKGLVSEELVEELKSQPDTKILSVGAGPAYLEQLLVSMGIDRERFVLSDMDSQVLPEEFKRFSFDMYSAWPRNLGKFFLILFPESVRIHSGNPPAVFEDLLRQALDSLEEGGEIRMDGHGQNSKVTDRIKLHLTEEGYAIDIQNDGKLLIVTKTP